MKTTTSASAMAAIACSRVSCAILASPSVVPDFSSSSSMRPPVSTTMNSTPIHSASPYVRSRVVPGSFCTIARRSPIIRLKSVDFPTFGRPTRATIGFATGVTIRHPSVHAKARAGMHASKRTSVNVQCIPPGGGDYSRLPGHDFDEPVDSAASIELCRAEQQVMRQTVVKSSKVKPAQDPRIEQLRVDLGCRALGLDGELVEERHIEGKFESVELRQPVGEVMRVLVAGAGNLPESFRSEARHVDGRGRRHQALVRADVAGRLLAADMLFARLERQHVSALALRVGGDTGDTARHLANERLPAAEQANVRATIALGHAQRLPFRRDDIRSQLPG